MSGAAKLLVTVWAMCALGFIGFGIAGFLDPAGRGSFNASATAFLIGTALVGAVDRVHAEQVRRIQAVERRLEALEHDNRPSS